MRELKILKIRKLYKVKENYVNENFAFETVFKKDVLKLINRLFHMRSPVSVLKKSILAYYEKLTDIFNN